MTIQFSEPLRYNSGLLCSLGAAGSHSVPASVFCGGRRCFPGRHGVAGPPSAEGQAHSAGPASPCATVWRAGRHRASLLLWTNWAMCWCPGVELGVRLPIGPYWTSPSFGTESTLFFPFFFFVLPIYACWWFWVAGLSRAQSGVYGRWKENPGNSPHCCSSSPDVPGQPSIFFPAFRVLLSF